MSGIDVLIRGGRIIDGTGNPWFYGDIGLAGRRIQAIGHPGSLSTEGVREVVDAAGMVVCPGFIDIQSHSIVSLMVDHRCLSKITQGVTTEIMGEGWTPAPAGGRVKEPLSTSRSDPDLQEWRQRARGWKRFSDWLEAMVERGVSPNVGSFLGGGTLREYVRAMDMGPSSQDDLRAMRRVTAAAMDDGAFGVSYALIYAPDTYADTEEIVSVCREVAARGGVYITHIRSEAENLRPAVEEALEIGRSAEVPVEIYHLKASGKSNWDKMPGVIERIDRARAEGVDVTADMYPYVGSGTGLSSVVPPWAFEGGRLFDNLRDPGTRGKIVKEMMEPSGGWEDMGRGIGPEGIMPIGFDRPHNKRYTGTRLSDIADDRRQNWADAAIDLLISEEQRIFTIYFGISEDNLRLQLPLPWIKISTDAGGVDPAWAVDWGPTHPRAYGTYPRVLGKYVREERLLTWEDAIRKMTSAVADRLGLHDRGVLRPGCWADVVILDPETIEDRATFEDSHRLSVGARDVWVNGTRVLADGVHTGAAPGTFVRGSGAR